MANEIWAISDGTFTLSETENKNQFYFYRNDGEVLTDIDREPIDLYHEYIMRKMMNGEITDVVMNNIYSDMSDDKKCIRLTICDIGKEPIEDANSDDSNKRCNIGEEPAGEANSTASSEHCDIGEEPAQNTNSTVSNKQPNFLKRLLHRIFG